MNAKCINTQGNYQCNCNEGYIGNGKICVFVNRCRERNNCEQLCVSTLESFECRCEPGFVLKEDRKECQGMYMIQL